MKAPDFDYVRPGSIDEVLSLLGAHRETAQVLAGGQSLVPMLNLRMANPDRVIDIGGLSELRGIRVGAGGVWIGALTTHRELLESPVVSRELPLLAQAVPHVAHLAIRNAGTLGGSLSLADPAAEYPAVALALGALMHLRSTRGVRTVAAADFFQGVYQTARAPDELLVGVEFPSRRPGQVDHFDELARRRGDYAMVGLAATATLRDGVIQTPMLAWFAVSDRAMSTPATAALLAGRRPDADTIAAARRRLAEELDPPSDLHADAATKRHLAGVLLGRALQQWERAS